MINPGFDLNENQRTSGTSVFHFVLFTILTAMIIGAVIIVTNNLLTRPLADEVQISEWKYACVEKYSGLPVDDLNWKTADKASSPQMENGCNYMVLKAKIPASMLTRTLSVITNNSCVGIFINKENKIDTISSFNLFSGNRLNTLAIPLSSTEEELEIHLYAPLNFSVSAYLSPTNTAVSLPMRILIMRILLFSAFLAFTICFLAFFIFADTDRTKKLKLLYTAIIGLFGMCAIVLEYFGYITGTKPSPVFFALGIAVMIAISSLTVCGIPDSVYPMSGMQKVVAVGSFVIAVLMLVSPYTGLTLLLMKYYAVWHLASTLLLVIGLVVKKELPRLNSSSYIQAGVAIIQLVFWLSLTQKNMPTVYEFMYFPLLAYLIYSVISTVAVFRSESRHIDPEIQQSPGVSAEAESGLDGILDIMKDIISQKCYDNEHIQHVSDYTGAICRAAKYSKEETDIIVRASLLHDIGKIAIPEKVLFKEEQLTQAEFDHIKSHVLYGYNILSSRKDKFMNLAAAIAKQHHEHYDGSGYLGLRGEDIDKTARIVSIADVFDALTVKRSYKKAWNFEDAYAYIINHSGDYFDPQFVEAFKNSRSDLISIYKNYYTK